MNINTNGLELKEMKSYSELLTTISSIDDAPILFDSNGYVVVYLDYKVLIGKVSNNNFEFYNGEEISENISRG